MLESECFLKRHNNHMDTGPERKSKDKSSLNPSDTSSTEFNWETFNMEKFFKDANAVGEIIRRAEKDERYGAV